MPSSKCIPKPNNRWAHLTLAYYQLLHLAFHDTANNNQRFVYVSETCVPCMRADKAYKRLTSNLEVTYVDDRQSTDNADRYDQTAYRPRKNAFPEHEAKAEMSVPSVQCASLLHKSGVLRGHFFKHSGWFSPNHRDAERLLRHKDAFEALNMVSAGDEHILSILKREEYVDTSVLEEARITLVKWDDTKIAKRRAMEVEEQRADFWPRMDRLKRMNPRKHRALMETRDELKAANSHPIQYTTHVPREVLAECETEKSVFLRKVRRQCNTENIKALL